MMLRWLWLSAAVVAMDQATKYLASTYLNLYEPVSVLPLVNLTLMHNTGAAFSLLDRAGGWERWLFIGLAVVVSVGIIAWVQRLPARAYWTAAGLALVLGGALGNLWDRVTLGYVVDFIDVYYQHWHWPAFNVADSAITVGATMLIFRSLLVKSPANPRLPT
jgi:signal peptidase II